MNALVKYDEACRAIAAARTVDVAKEIRNEHEAIRVYARQSQNKDLEIHAMEIRIRAERRLGELIAAQKATVGLAKGGAGRKGGGTSGSKKVPQLNAPPTLAEAGIDKKLSAQSQKLAALPVKEFERRLDDWREVAKDRSVPKVLLTTPGRTKTARPRTATTWTVDAAIDRVQQVIDAELADRTPGERQQFGGLLRQIAFYLEGKKAS